MATIRKRGAKYEVQVRRKGQASVTKSFIQLDDATSTNGRNSGSYIRMQAQIGITNYISLFKRHIRRIQRFFVVLVRYMPKSNKSPVRSLKWILEAYGNFYVKF